MYRCQYWVMVQIFSQSCHISQRFTYKIFINGHLRVFSRGPKTCSLLFAVIATGNMPWLSKQGKLKIRKMTFSKCCGDIFAPSWVTAECDYLSCAGRVQHLHRTAFIRCCLLWWCFGDVLDHTLQYSLSPASRHLQAHFGHDALYFPCNNI